MLVGVVTDPSSGVLPGAKLTAINTDTEVRYSAQSNGEGNYVIPYLTPGFYRLMVELDGFRTHERSGIPLRTGDRLRIDIVLEVGRFATSVSVPSDSRPLDSGTAASGFLIDGRRVNELPVAHGNVYHLIQLSVGLVYGGSPTLDRPFEPTHIANYSIGGAYGLRNEITMDGTPNSSVTAGRNQTAAAYVPPADIVGEMRVTTVPFDATIGNTEGGAISISLKSGTNTPHGTIYYNNQNPVLFANSWMANKRGQPRSEFSYHRWGASLLGPMVLPKIYNGKNRTFFLWGYEGIEERRPRSLGTQTVPGYYERSGNFSELLALGSNYQLYDPATRRPGRNGSIVADPFPGNIIPRNRISPISQRILRYFSEANVVGTPDGQNNLYRPDLAEPIDYQNNAVRLDHYISPRHRLFGTAAMYNRSSNYLNYFDNVSTGETFQFMARRATIDEVYTISPTTVMNVRYGYNRFVREADLNPASRGFDLRTLAPDNRAWAVWNQSLDDGSRRFPAIDIAGYYDLVGTSSSGVLFRPQDTHSFSASIDRVQGQHTLQFGGEYRVYRKGEVNPYPASGVGTVGGSTTGWLRFGEDWTKGPTDTSAAPPIGAGLASFLLGLPTGGGIDRRASFAEQSSVSAFYIQDEWKATHRLTFTLGLRYELEGPLTERFNRSVREFDRFATLPIEADAMANYQKIVSQLPGFPASQINIRGGVRFAGVDGRPRTLYERDWNNLMPRAGVAFRLTPSTAIRAGYGVFFGAMGVRRGDVYQTGFSLTTPLVASRDNGLTFVATLDDPFPAGAAQPSGASRGVMTNVGDRISYFNTDFVAPYMQRWQFSIQRELSANTLFQVSYVGNRGTKAETTRNADGIPLRYLSTSGTRDQARIDYLTRQEIDNPFYGVLSDTTPLGSTRKISRAQLITAFPQFTRMETTTNEGYSWYHSFQASLDRRFKSGITVGASYTWSKLMEANAFLNDMDPEPYRTISNLDFPQRFSASWIYELPFGRGRKLAGSAHGPLSKLAEGWQVEGLYVYQSGASLGFDNILFIGDIKNIPLSSSQRSSDRWFNTNAGFVRDTAEALGSNVRTFPLRFSGIRGPAMNNWDLSVLKETRINERATMQLRGEFLNAMNHVWLDNPNTTPTSSAFGTITSERGNMRRVQLGIKLVY